MNKNKKFYSQPEAELLVIRFEQNLLTGSQWNTATPTAVEWGDDVDL